MTNLGLTIVVSRVAGLGALGTYAVISVTLLGYLGFLRTLLTDPWLASKEPEATSYGRELRTLMLSAALASALPIVIVCWATSHGTGADWFIGVAIAPMMMVQDTGRYAAYKANRPWLALASDCLLLAGFLVFVAAGFALGYLQIAWILCSWLLGYALALLPTGRLMIGPVGFTNAIAWWNKVCRHLGLALFQDSAAFLLSVNGTTYLLAGLASAQAVGAVRVVNSLFSPVALVFTGLSMWLVPVLSRKSTEDSETLRRYASTGLTLFGSVLGALVVVVGPFVAPFAFGADAQPSRLALLFGALSTLFNAVAATWISTVKVFGKYHPISWARMISGFFMIAVIFFIPHARNSEGYLALLAGQNCLIAAISWKLQRLVGVRASSSKTGRHLG